MADVKISPGPAVPSPTLVQTDQDTILGDGSHGNPLRTSFVNGIDVEDDGVPLANNPEITLNFTGAGVTASSGGAHTAVINIPGIAGVSVQDEGTPITGNPHPTLNFLGTGVTATDAGGGVAQIAIPKGITVEGEGSPVAGNPHASVNFTGAGVTVTEIAGVATVAVPGVGANSNTFTSVFQSLPALGLAFKSVGNGSSIAADCRILNTAQALGVVVAFNLTNHEVTLQDSGIVTLTTSQWDAVKGGSGGLVAGAAYYLGPTPIGGFLQTAKPTTSGQAVAQVGVALSTTELLLSTPCFPLIIP